MKKIIKCLLFVLLGYIIGEFFFGDGKRYIEKLQMMDHYYFLLEGVYSDKDLLQRDIRNLSQKVVDYQENQYYVYVGITRDREVAEVLRNIYKKMGFQIYQKEKTLSSSEFSENVRQFDLLIKETEDEDQILTIERVVLANYEEILKKQ